MGKIKRRDNPNLFTPSFGIAPHMFVGRDKMLSDIRRGLETGPRSAEFTTLLMGPRGSGKTVSLEAVEGMARESGWLVLSCDASTDGIGERITEEIELAQETYEDVPDLRERTTTETTSSGVNVWPLGFQRVASESIQAKWSPRRQLAALGRHAQTCGTGVLLTVDEFHAGDRSEIRRVAADLQRITKRDEFPVAFVGAGLSEMKHTVLEDKRMTFFHRVARVDVPGLTVADAMRCIRFTIEDAGGVIEDSALRTLAESSGSLPYRMQLLGHFAWTIADAPSRPVNDRAAAEAITETDKEMTERVYSPTWHDLSSSEMAYLVALADLGGEATRTQIAYETGAPSTELARTENRLTNFGCITAKDLDSAVTFGGVMQAEAVRRFRDAAARYDRMSSPLPAGTNRAANKSGRGSKSQRCNTYMPRAKARCVRRAGHPGRHRSR